jgi:peptidoglycan/LPS O-acetylase OafA/YrhL
VLSGFLIGGILLKEISQKNEFSLSQLVVFWKRRWFRTLPNYYLILLLNFLFLKLHFINQYHNKPDWTFLVFLQNFNNTFYGFFSESWSLAIEEWFYIFTPLLMLLLIKIFSAKQTFLIGTFTLIIFPIIYRFTIIQSNEIDFLSLENLTKKMVLTRLDSIGYGLLAAWILFYYNELFIKYKFHCVIIAIALQLFLEYNKHQPISNWLQVFYFSLLPIVAMMFLPIAYSLKTGNGYIAKSITHLSKISYSMYLINLGLLAEVIESNFNVTSLQDGIIKYLIYWVMVISASTIIYKFFEKPIMNLRDKW